MDLFIYFLGTVFVLGIIYFITYNCARLYFTIKGYYKIKVMRSNEKKLDEKIKQEFMKVNISKNNAVDIYTERAKDKSSYRQSSKTTNRSSAKNNGRCSVELMESTGNSSFQRNLITGEIIKIANKLDVHNKSKYYDDEDEYNYDDEEELLDDNYYEDDEHEEEKTNNKINNYSNYGEEEIERRRREEIIEWGAKTTTEEGERVMEESEDACEHAMQDSIDIITPVEHGGMDMTQGNSFNDW